MRQLCVFYSIFPYCFACCTKKAVVRFLLNFPFLLLVLRQHVRQLCVFLVLLNFALLLRVLNQNVKQLCVFFGFLLNFALLLRVLYQKIQQVHVFSTQIPGGGGKRGEVITPLSAPRVFSLKLREGGGACLQKFFQDFRIF